VFICIGARDLKTFRLLFCYFSATVPLLFCYFSVTFLFTSTTFAATSQLLFIYFSASFSLLFPYLYWGGASSRRVCYQPRLICNNNIKSSRWFQKNNIVINQSFSKNVWKLFKWGEKVCIQRLQSVQRCAKCVQIYSKCV
jgi:hypothetical protein